MRKKFILYSGFLALVTWGFHPWVHPHLPSSPGKMAGCSAHPVHHHEGEPEGHSHSDSDHSHEEDSCELCSLAPDRPPEPETRTLIRSIRQTFEPDQFFQSNSAPERKWFSTLFPYRGPPSSTAC